MRTDKEHILIMTSEFPPQPGGIGNHAYNLAKYLDAYGHLITVITDQRSFDGNEEKEFDASLNFSVIRIKRMRLRFLMYLQRIQLLLKQFRSSSYIIATGKFALWSVAFCTLFFNKPTIAVIHGSEVNFKNTLLRWSINWSLKRMGRLVAVSEFTKGLISKFEEKTTVISNGIMFSNWNTFKSASESVKGNPVLTTVGRVSERKGQLNVIKHLPELARLYPDIHYHCIGIPTQANAFMNIARSLHVDKMVTFHGSLKDDELKQILGQTNVFLMLSSESKSGDVEGFGIAILEANAMGVPAIGAVACGIEDAIKNGETGRLIHPDNSLELKEALVDILDHKGSYSESAQQWAQQHDWSQIIKYYLELIK